MVRVCCSPGNILSLICIIIIITLNSLVGLVPVNMINAVRQIVAPTKWTMRNRDIFQKALDVLLAPLHLGDMFMSMCSLLRTVLIRFCSKHNYPPFFRLQHSDLGTKLYFHILLVWFATWQITLHSLELPLQSLGNVAVQYA